MSSNRRFALPLLAALALAVLAVGVSACGYSSDSKHVVEGEPVELGELSINVTFSRYLNPNDNEDAAYLVGQEPPPKGYSFFGVFLEVQNESDEVQHLPTMWITDAEGTEHAAFPSKSLYALQFGGEVEPGEQVPVLDSTADLGPIEGSVVIFRLPESVSENRPLTLHVQAAGDEEAKVTLDL
jgi:hypothetical protein